MSGVWLALTLLAAGSAWAHPTNYWIGSTDPDFNQPTNWSLGTVPGPTDFVYFTNVTGQAIRFSASVTNYPLRIYNSDLAFDLNGYAWRSKSLSRYDNSVIQSDVSLVTLHFSSSSAARHADGNTMTVEYFQDSGFGGTEVKTLKIDDALGYPVTVDFSLMYNGTKRPFSVTIGGTNSRLLWSQQFQSALAGDFLVTTQAALHLINTGAGGTFSLGGHLGLGADATVTVKDANLVTATTYPLRVSGRYGKASVYLEDSLWTAGQHVIVGSDGYHNLAHPGAVYLTNSVFVGTSMHLGLYRTDSPSVPGSGLLSLQAGSEATFSNRLVVTDSFYDLGVRERSRLEMTDSIINLGGGIEAGALTNLAHMRIAGTIRGQGTSPATVYAGAGSMNWIGDGVASLTLSNANFEVASGATLLLEFGDDTNDQIIVSNGTATIGGTVVFSNPPSFFPKHGTMWDFIEADNLVYTADDNMADLMSAYGLKTDYIFGVVGGRILRLSIIERGTLIMIR